MALEQPLTDDARTLWRRQSECGCHVVGGGTVRAPLRVEHCATHRRPIRRRPATVTAICHCSDAAGVAPHATADVGRCRVRRAESGAVLLNMALLVLPFAIVTALALLYVAAHLPTLNP